MVDLVEAQDPETKDLKAKVRWNCRRGMLELDMMLLAFVDNAYDESSDITKRNFKALLKSSDQQLYSWLIGQELPDDPRFQDLILVIRHICKNGTN
jgi:antitoxin CptB